MQESKKWYSYIVWWEVVLVAMQTLFGNIMQPQLGMMSESAYNTKPLEEQTSPRVDDTFSSVWNERLFCCYILKIMFDVPGLKNVHTAGRSQSTVVLVHSGGK